MIREVELLDYLPQYIQEYPEIKSIMSSEQPDVQILEDTTEQVKDDMFIQFTDEVGIARYEKMLNITPLDDDKLEDRQAKVLSIYNNNVVYTFKGLVERLKILCGEDNFSTELIANEYKLNVGIGLSSKKMFKVIEDMLKNMIPANIEWNLSLLYNRHEDLAKYTHAELAQYTQEQLRDNVI